MHLFTYSVAMFRGWWCGHVSPLPTFSQWVDSQVCRHRGFRDAACAWLHAQPGLGWWDLAWWNSDTNWFCIESTKRRIAIPGVFLSFSDFSQVRYIYFDTGNPAPVLTKNWHISASYRSNEITSAALRTRWIQIWQDHDCGCCWVDCSGGESKAARSGLSLVCIKGPYLDKLIRGLGMV